MFKCHLSRLLGSCPHKSSSKRLGVHQRFPDYSGIQLVFGISGLFHPAPAESVQNCSPKLEESRVRQTYTIGEKSPSHSSKCIARLRQGSRRTIGLTSWCELAELYFRNSPATRLATWSIRWETRISSGDESCAWTTSEVHTPSSPARITRYSALALFWLDASAPGSPRAFPISTALGRGVPMSDEPECTSSTRSACKMN